MACAQVAALKEAYRDVRSEADAAAAELAALRAAHADLQREKDLSAEQVGHDVGFADVHRSTHSPAVIMHVHFLSWTSALHRRDVSPLCSDLVWKAGST